MHGDAMSGFWQGYGIGEMNHTGGDIPETRYVQRNDATARVQRPYVEPIPVSLTGVSVNEGSNASNIAGFADKVNCVSGVVGTTSDISAGAGFKASLGVWRDFSKMRYYSSGWSGANQYVWKTFGIAKNIGYGAMGLGFASDLYLSASINPQTGKPYQSWEETGLNTGVTGVSLWAGGIWGMAIQLDYSTAKIYFKAINKHPGWVMRPRPSR